MVAIYIEVDGVVYSFSDSGTLSFLQDFGAGIVDKLVIEGLPNAIESSLVSLRYLLEMDETLFTSSTPVHVHAHELECEGCALVEAGDELS
jgi:hypothetical protein